MRLDSLPEGLPKNSVKGFFKRSMYRTFRACGALFKIRVAECLQYRAAALGNASISVFWGLLQVVTFTVFYTYGNPDSAALTLAQAVSYAWLVQSLHGLVGNLNVDGDLREKITSGNVALELCRPLDLYSHWFAKCAANRVGNFPWRAAITLFAALVMPAALRLSAPDSVMRFVLFLLSVCSAFLLCVAYSMLLTAIRVGLTWGEGPTWVFVIIGGVLSGAYLPLPLWPDFLQRALMIQPFAGLMDIPFRLYVGSIPPGDAFGAIGLQLLWTAIIVIVGKALLHRRLNHLVVQGG